MGITARKRRSEDRKKRKRAAKAAKRELYASLAGTSKKGKRQKKSVLPGFSDHIGGNCGNPGCDRCRSALIKPGCLTCKDGRLIIRPSARFDLAI
jgi:hypothetical protein